MNNLYIHAIEKAVSYWDRVSFESLPILPTGTTILSGVSAQIPVVVRVGQLPAEAEPNSRTMLVTDMWIDPGVGAEKTLTEELIFAGLRAGFARLDAPATSVEMYTQKPVGSKPCHRFCDFTPD